MISRRAFNAAALTVTAFGAGSAVSTASAASGSGVRDGRGGYSSRNVTFPSNGETLVGKLFVPSSQGPHPAVAIIGPVAFVKEQSPMQYATRLAARGIAALIFDPRNHGESSGTPRRHESGSAKIEDLYSALGFLATLEDIDADRLSLLGICQGVNWAIETAASDDRVKSLGIVAGHYLTPETVQMYLGDETTIADRMERSARAAIKFEETGEVDYVPIVGSDDAFLTAKASADWYLPWESRAPWMTYRGGWENRITAMSEADIWNWRIDETAPRLTKPVLMVHGDMAASGTEIPRRIFDDIASTQKELHWVDGANQLQFYEDAIVIDAVVDPLADFFLSAPERA